mgnify:CR=1 FL=1
MERVLIISYIISMILMVGFIYCVYREKYWVFEFVNKIKKPIQQLVYVLLMLISSYAYICFSLLIEANFNAVICAVLLLLLIWAMDYLFSLCFKKSDLGISEKNAIFLWRMWVPAYRDLLLQVVMLRNWL